MKSKIKELKNKMKKNEKWNRYKIKFQHEQMRLMSSKIFLTLNKEISVEKLYDMELKILEEDLSDKMFVLPYRTLEDSINCNVDYLAQYIWYIYQISIHEIDRKKSLYNTENCYRLNSKKRDFFSNFIESMDQTKSNFNITVKKIMKLVF